MARLPLRMALRQWRGNMAMHGAPASHSSRATGHDARAPWLGGALGSTTSAGQASGGGGGGGGHLAQQAARGDATAALRGEHARSIRVSGVGGSELQTHDQGDVVRHEHRLADARDRVPLRRRAACARERRERRRELPAHDHARQHVLAARRGAAVPADKAQRRC